MNLIIAGSRDFNNYELLKQKLDKILADIHEPITIFCGEAQGADQLGKRYALESGYEVRSFPYMSEHGRAGGPIRNEAMAKEATHCIVFWDGKSKGTASMIRIAERYKLKLRVIRYEAS